MSAAPHDRPLAVSPLISYRYKGRYGFIMIGAKNDGDALKEAARSTDDPTTLDRLEVWTGEAYAPVAVHALRLYKCARCDYESKQTTNHTGPTHSWGRVNTCPACPPWAKFAEFGGSTQWHYAGEVPTS